MKKEISLTVMPHYVNDDLLELLVPVIEQLKQRGHQSPEIIFDDGCCSAIFCEDCGRWGHAVSNYSIDDEVVFKGQEFGGAIFEADCATPYEASHEATLKSIDWRKDEQ
ncbi:hypothetical protein UFOVP1344_20 [uncultured Caudovirales phage]|uniref:Uncharacterized protein n=1 Tax=uncultured Caudovirales phage TaxID=2100421 RepID=A0A6J5Q7U8_9CAUD|nr:hypothetical protein UFOVP1005_20 [uncultured Caudovirales phage]CAB4199961.1 hypothetical protein UFOVP1344_20 [uncultured Caudovirales phage]CAB4218272.1 hypothetical protein UFOVP1602_20 [uncultured Caudovirales phage]